MDSPKAPDKYSYPTLGDRNEREEGDMVDWTAYLARTVRTGIRMLERVSRLLEETGPRFGIPDDQRILRGPVHHDCVWLLKRG